MLTTRDMLPSRTPIRAKPRRVLTVRPWINVTSPANGENDVAGPDRRVVTIGEVVEVEASLAQDLVSSGHARYHEHGDPVPTQAEVRIIRPVVLSADSKRVAQAEEAGVRSVASDTILRVPMGLARALIERGDAQPWAVD